MAPAAVFIVKLHGRCNLTCDYCYIYEMADQSWRAEPAIMSRQTIEQTAQRIREHLVRPDAPQVVNVTLHGGEPLIAGAALISFAANAFHAVATPATMVRLSMQTNGVLLNNSVLDVLNEHSIRVGVSLDGDAQAHDRHRRYANGRDGYREVADGIAALRRPPYVHQFGGLLCTVDIANDPLAVYRGMLAFEPPAIDFLLPHATWDQPPVRPGSRPAPYGECLVAIFDTWYATSPTPTRVRLFDEIMSLVLGAPAGPSRWV